MQAYRENINGHSDSKTTLRTIVEHGTRVKGSEGGHSSGSSTNVHTISAILKQHADDQTELQELNTKFARYLDRVHYLETLHGQLTAQLDELRNQLGSRSSELQSASDPELQSLRTSIDISLRDHILQELRLKQYENDILQTRQRIAAFEGDLPARLHALQQDLSLSEEDLIQLKHQIDRRTASVLEQRTKLENLVHQFDALQSELVNHRLERMMVENELQTLREEGAFQDATYQAYREEILSLDAPAIDISKFYRNELTRAILDIRQDFEVLSQTQGQELEEYYRVKTEQIREQAAAEAERRRIKHTETIETTSNSSGIAESHEAYRQLQTEYNRLQTQFDAMLNDLTTIQEEHNREKYKSEQELLQIQEDITNKQAIIDSALDNNTSLRFELSTYGHLLNSEEVRLDRLEERGSLYIPSSSSSQSGQSVQQMGVSKVAKGPILFDSVDLINDCVIIANESISGGDQSLGNWTIRRQNDKQSEIIYKLSSSFTLKPRKKIRILSKRSPQAAKPGDDVLVADQLETWGKGDVMVTRLVDSNNDEKAKITQTRIKS